MAQRIDRESGRYFLKDDVRGQVDFRLTDQSRGLEPPPVQKPCPAGAPRTPLPGPGAWKGIQSVSLEQAIGRRESRRTFRRAPLSLDEIGFLLWAAQGVRDRSVAHHVLRTAPSAGARHPFETYVLALNVAGLPPGRYRYLGLEHELVLEAGGAEALEGIGEALLGQMWAERAAAVVVWTAIPARTEWRYAEAAYKVIAVDAGHACQNLYLACECVGAGTCSIGAYRQDLMDHLLNVDGSDEFTVYIAPVGKV